MIGNDQGICIAVTDRRALGRPIRFVSRYARNGKPTTTDNRPTWGKDGTRRTEDRIRYFTTTAAALRFIGLFPVNRKRLYTLWGPQGMISTPCTMQAEAVTTTTTATTTTATTTATTAGEFGFMRGLTQ
jgi:hypothetical protein